MSEIRLRAIERGDLEHLQNWRNAPEIRHRTREYRLLTMEHQEAWFGRLREDRNTIMFGIESSGGNLLGVCGLTYISWIDRRSEVSLYIAPDQAGQGYGAAALNALIGYAFEVVNLHKLTAEIYSFNEASLGLFTKCGFHEEGRLRRHVYRLGQWHDSIMMALFAEEWPRSHEEKLH